MTKKYFVLLFIVSLSRSVFAKDVALDPQSLIFRKGLYSVITFMDAQPAIFPKEKPKADHFLNREQREVVWSTWKSFLDYSLALESIEKKYSNFYESETANAEQQAFLNFYSAFLAQYRFSLDFIAKVDTDSKLTVLLNEQVPEIGLPAGTYDQLKYKFLHVSIASKFAAYETFRKTHPYAGAEIDEFEKAIANDSAKIWAAGLETGPLLTAKNALQIIQNTGFKAWFPVQSRVAEWMGDVKVHRVEEFLINPDQIAAMAKVIQPGDIFLERREWYLSNVGLPGYWPHAALYIGTPDERRAFFNDATVKDWVKNHGEQSGDFEKLLQKLSTSTYAESLKAFEQHTPRFLEAVSEGVSFISLEHSGAADTLAVLRPRISNIDKAEAILRAFHYAGRPYDFNFDFLTDSTLVCSELVYKAYEPSQKLLGLSFPLTDMLGRKVLPPNEIVRLFDQQYGTPQQQMDLVLFLDGDEHHKKAALSDVAAFRESYKRPKWHVVEH